MPALPWSTASVDVSSRTSVHALVEAVLQDGGVTAAYRFGDLGKE
jgi:hypothetical protein